MSYLNNAGSWSRVLFNGDVVEVFLENRFIVIYILKYDVHHSSGGQGGFPSICGYYSYTGIGVLFIIQLGQSGDNPCNGVYTEPVGLGALALQDTVVNVPIGPLVFVSSRHL